MNTDTAGKVNLLGLTRPQLEDFLESLGEKRFRAQQIMKWIHFFGVDDFEAMTNLGKALRGKLADVAEIRGPGVALEHTSADGTRKWVLELDQGNRVETVFIPDGNRGTLCVSSQVGCALDCSFCSTGKQGFHRDLSVAEIVGQLWVAQRSFGPPSNRGLRNITNVVMMGMGEPLLNFESVIHAMELMKDDLGYGIAKKRLTLSTSGIVPRMYELYERIDVSLAVSLHAPNDPLRDQLVPVNKKYPLSELMAACREYVDRFPDTRRVTMEYVLIEGVNDKFEHAEQLIALLQNVPSKINLIPFNPFPNSGYKRPNGLRIKAFQDRLMQAGFVTTIRTTRGDDIDAACGQLVGKVQDRTRRAEQWRTEVAARQRGRIKVHEASGQ
ncbi:MAG: 23S rRNA (adenine(2503)-C(2))-methyltransferase RlmN [Pseudomonadota bacterium]|nr:23S rRNA (adenine(2503)-C(2))-methyltransferase RlmN [Pseudomonadales bacterium]MDY6920572.1 23S rRNA (adenine(2503)-C(2))-methyltransferase RlmN [Pseudomonadota bacterium]